MALAIQHSEEPGVVQSGSSEALATLSGKGLLRPAYDHLVSFFCGEGLLRSAYDHLVSEIKFF